MEQCRSLLQEHEAWEGAALNCLGECQQSVKRRRILWGHRGLYCIHQLQNCSLRCLQALKSEALKEDVKQKSEDVWTSFYDKLKDIQSYYKKFPSAVLGEGGQIDASSFTAQAIEEIGNLSKVFRNSEELRGKVLDLTEPFHRFLNWSTYRKLREREHRQNVIARLKKIKLDKEKKKVKDDQQLTINDIHIDESDPTVQKRLTFQEIDYAKYTKQYVTGLDTVPRHCKYGDNDYMNYANCLLTYLENFYRLYYPLDATAQFLSKLDQSFEELWEKKLLKAWYPPTHQLTNLYCPYTNKLFGSTAAAEGHKNSKKYRAVREKMEAEAVSQGLPASEATGYVIESIKNKSVEQDKELARIEFRISQLLDKLSDILEATLQNLRKKQSRTLQEIYESYREIADDEEVPSQRDAASSDDSDAFDINTSRIKNPLNLPVGWDGKPIPYWLYRLHGLSHSYTCEICGNHKYWGKKVFENHFREWRHAFGMRCLKIPNTVHFKEITKIEDALNLYERLRNDTEGKAFLPDQEVEVEDQQGNVMTPQTYEDLRKQGLL